MSNLTELPDRWNVIPLPDFRGPGGCIAPTTKIHSLHVGGWWLQIHEYPLPPAQDPRSCPPLDWSIIYQDIVAASGTTAISLAKTKVLLKQILNEIEDSPPNPPQYNKGYLAG